MGVYQDSQSSLSPVMKIKKRKHTKRKSLSPICGNALATRNMKRIQTIIKTGNLELQQNKILPKRKQCSRSPQKKITRLVSNRAIKQFQFCRDLQVDFGKTLEWKCKAEQLLLPTSQVGSN